MYRERGWSLKGVKIIGEVSGKKFDRRNMMAGLCNKVCLAPFVYNANTNTELLNIWLRDCLLPLIGPGKTIVLDNASFHKNKKTIELVEAAGCTVIFLPPYSPDLNPIEKFWSWIKREVRSNMHNFDSLDEVLDYVFVKAN